eukprot:5666055-Amphidinium_carterae.2
MPKQLFQRPFSDNVELPLKPKALDRTAKETERPSTYAKKTRFDKRYGLDGLSQLYNRSLVTE